MNNHSYRWQFMVFVAVVVLACTPVLSYAQAILCAGGVPNGVVETPEQCDDGNSSNDDACLNSCIIANCGDGFVQDGVEQCDGGIIILLQQRAAETSTCNSDCTLSICGDGKVNTTDGEQCDDGNDLPGDGCGAFCESVDSCFGTCLLEDEPGCGNGAPDAGEQCDDGNLVDGDGCDSNCTYTLCGNGIVTSTEECDDGNNVPGDGCGAACPDGQRSCATDADCGAGEFCDDDTDTCEPQIIIQFPRAVCLVPLVSTCQDEPGLCGNGIVNPLEQCDDGNVVSGDGCDANCTVTECGNGIVTLGEECDDGNNIPGDDCGAECPPGGLSCGTNDDCANTGCQCPQGQICEINLDDSGTCVADVPVCGTNDDCANTAVCQCPQGWFCNVLDLCQPSPSIISPRSICITRLVPTCQSESSGSCGDGVRDPDEGCDLGASNGVLLTGCTADCNPQEGWSFALDSNVPVVCTSCCTDLIDNDGDSLTDCSDPDCPDDLPPCVPVGRDPARIVFRPGTRVNDRFYMHGRLRPSTLLDPANETVGISLQNANGVLYRGTLEPGALKAPSSSRRFSFVNRAAAARSAEGGLNRLRILKRPGYYTIAVRAYADLSAATLPYMSIRVVIGDDEFVTEGTWKPTKMPTGWWIHISESSR